MALQSQLFRNDPKLEAAAVSDPSHITRGMHGEYVEKIQLALIQLDSASIQPDGAFGPQTAAAVLAYKRKRSIVNRAYQTAADDIVGKMTMEALDAEMLQAERTAKPPRIVGVRPVLTMKYQNASSARRLPPARERNAKSFVEPAKIIVPNGLPWAMELKEGATGTFQIVDGIGGTVRCWNENIGLVFLPDEPLAHGGAMRVTTSPQTFAVLAKNAGETNIEASKPAQTFPLGDILHLVVIADSVNKTWHPQWSVELKFRMNCNPWASHAFGAPVPGMGIQSQLIEWKGGVNPDPSVNLDDFELGILQNVTASKMIGAYVNSTGTPAWTVTISCPTPVRDAADDSPIWYSKTAVKQMNEPDGKNVESNDRPQNVVPWQTKDKKGSLVSTSGLDSYCTWLAIRQKSTGAFTFLKWVTWDVDWACTFDLKTEGRNLTGTTRKTGEGDGQGSKMPVTTGKRAIEVTTMTWTGPAGGY